MILADDPWDGSSVIIPCPFISVSMDLFILIVLMFVTVVVVVVVVVDVVVVDVGGVPCWVGKARGG